MNHPSALPKRENDRNSNQGRELRAGKREDLATTSLEENHKAKERFELGIMKGGETTCMMEGRKEKGEKFKDFLLPREREGRAIAKRSLFLQNINELGPER